MDGEVAPRKRVGAPGGQQDDDLRAALGRHRAALGDLLANPRGRGPGAASIANASSVRPVVTIPGSNAKTETPWLLVSAARFSVSLISADLETA